MHWYLLDRQNSVKKLLSVVGTAVYHVAYDDFGRVKKTSGSEPAVADRYRYQGMEHDAGNGLYLVRGRPYDPTNGRWQTQGGGPRPDQPNPYPFQDNNPTSIEFEQDSFEGIGQLHADSEGQRRFLERTRSVLQQWQPGLVLNDPRRVDSPAAPTHWQGLQRLQFDEESLASLMALRQHLQGQRSTGGSVDAPFLEALEAATSNDKYRAVGALANGGLGVADIYRKVTAGDFANFVTGSFITGDTRLGQLIDRWGGDRFFGISLDTPTGVEAQIPFWSDIRRGLNASARGATGEVVLHSVLAGLGAVSVLTGIGGFAQGARVGLQTTVRQYLLQRTITGGVGAVKNVIQHLALTEGGATGAELAAVAGTGFFYGAVNPWGTLGSAVGSALGGIGGALTGDRDAARRWLLLGDLVGGITGGAAQSAAYMRWYGLTRSVSNPQPGTWRQAGAAAGIAAGVDVTGATIGGIFAALTGRDWLAGAQYGMMIFGSTRAAFESMLLKPCFPGETQVETANGFQRIDELKEGDWVWSRNEFDPHGPLDLKRVEEVFIRPGRIWHLHVGGRVIRVTPEHPVYVQSRGWTPVGDLEIGNVIRTKTGWLPVEDLLDTGEDETVYNLRVAEWHTYFVGCDEWGFSVWAHNAYGVDGENAHTETQRLGRDAARMMGMHEDAFVFVLGDAGGGKASFQPNLRGANRPYRVEINVRELQGLSEPLQQKAVMHEVEHARQFTREVIEQHGGDWNKGVETWQARALLAEQQQMGRVYALNEIRAERAAFDALARNNMATPEVIADSFKYRQHYESIIRTLDKYGL